MDTKTNLDYLFENITSINKKNTKITDTLKDFLIENIDTVEWWFVPDSALTEDRKLLKHLIKRKSINIRLISEKFKSKAQPSFLKTKISEMVGERKTKSNLILDNY